MYAIIPTLVRIFNNKAFMMCHTGELIHLAPLTHHPLDVTRIVLLQHENFTWRTLVPIRQKIAIARVIVCSSCMRGQVAGIQAARAYAIAARMANRFV